MKIFGLYASFIIYGIIASHANIYASAVWPASLYNECANPDPAWIWCDDFESDRSSGYFESTLNRQAQVGLNSSTAAAFHFKQNTQSAGGLSVAFGKTPSSHFKPVDAGLENYREIFWRMFVYIPDGWIGNGADKLSRATIFARSDWSQAMIAHVWSGKDPGPQASLLMIDPASGTDASGNLMTVGYNDFNNLRWLGSKPGSYPVFSSENFGVWHCIEAQVKLNDANQNNGLFRIFINNTLEAEHVSLNWVGSYAEYGINAVFFENYWNSGSPVNQTRYFDNIVISTKPIGCGSAARTPMPPYNLNVSW